MSYSHIGTMSDEDAMRFARGKTERLNRYPEWTKRAHENSCLFADEIHQLKKNSFYLAPGALPKSDVLILRRKFFNALRSTLSGRKVRNFVTSNAATHITDPTYKTFSASEDLSHAWNVLPGLSLANPLLDVPEILHILENELLQGIITGFYESIPKLTFAKGRISFNNSLGPLDTQLWHSDPQSFRNLKVLIYLTDVDEDSGPFEIIKGSHIEKFEGWYNPRAPLPHESTTSSTRHSSEKLLEIYGKNRCHKVLGNPGDIIFADATAFHRGNVPINQNRCAIILNFNVHEEYGLAPCPIKIYKKDYNKISPNVRPLVDDLEVIEGEEQWLKK